MTHAKHGFLAGAVAAVFMFGAVDGAQAQGRTAWEGFHFGGHVGWADNDYNANAVNGAPGLASNLGGSDGFAGGFLYGASWQSENWVLGTDSVWTFSDSSSGTATTAAGLAFSADTNYTTETRLRFGYLVLPEVLVFGTAGIAFADVDVTGAALAGRGGDKRFFGWTYGGGLETQFNDRWFARVEYAHIDFDDESFNAIAGGTHKVDLDSDAVRAAVGYRFDWSPFDIFGPR
jgi:outer membrane immunogenic protein